MKNFFDNLAGIILVLFIIIYAIGFIQNSIETTKNIVDVWENGLPIFREGYIPPSKRKVEGVKFVPEGADPRDYIKDDWLAVVLTVYGFETLLFQLRYRDELQHIAHDLIPFTVLKRINDKTEYAAIFDVIAHNLRIRCRLRSSGNKKAPSKSEGVFS